MTDMAVGDVVKVPFRRMTRFAIVCPITTRIRPFASSTVLPAGPPIGGEVLTAQVRSVDTLARPLLPVGARVPDAVIGEVRDKLMLLVGVLT